MDGPSEKGALRGKRHATDVGAPVTTEQPLPNSQPGGLESAGPHRWHAAHAITAALGSRRSRRGHSLPKVPESTLSERWTTIAGVKVFYRQSETLSPDRPCCMCTDSGSRAATCCPRRSFSLRSSTPLSPTCQDSAEAAGPITVSTCPI